MALNLSPFRPSNDQTEQNARGTFNGAAAYQFVGDYMLRLMKKNRGDEVVLCCSGRIVAGEETWNLYNAIITQQDRRRIVLDLSGVSRIDAGGLGVLVASKLWANGAGVGLELIRSKAVQELLDITNLGPLFEIGSARPMLLPTSPMGSAHADSAVERRCA